MLKLAKFLYISCFTKSDECSQLWSDFAPDHDDVCLVTSTGALQAAKPSAVSIIEAEYGVDWDGANPSDRVYQDRIDYEAICTGGGLEYQEHGDFSFAQALKYLLFRFRYQNEVRLVYSWTSFEAADHGDEVVFVPFPLGEVLSEVAIRSDAPPAHEGRVRQLLKSVSCNAKVVRSKLP
jgi:hypothetical protein